MQTIKVTFLNNSIHISKDTLNQFCNPINPINPINYIKRKVIEEFKLNVKQNEIFLILPNKSKLLTSKLSIDDCHNIYEIEVIKKQTGGMAIAMFAVLIVPVIMIGKGVGRLIKVLVSFFKMFIKMIEMIPIIFDPPTFINDVMFGVSWGINKVFSKAMDSITESKDQPKDANEEGPFGDNDQGRMTCLDPTLGMILLLVICPPLAIVYKMGAAGLVSAIICGVLCVKLYYFPGLLFAILHVLC